MVGRNNDGDDSVDAAADASADLVRRKVWWGSQSACLAIPAALVMALVVSGFLQVLQFPPLLHQLMFQPVN